MKCPYCSGSGKVDATFASRLRAARNDSGLTQEGVAEQLQISRTQIANMESGRTQGSLDVVLKAASLFGCSVDWLLGRDGFQKDHPTPKEPRDA